MRIAMGQFWYTDDAILRYCRQLGAEGVVYNTPDLGGPPWKVEDVVALREKVESFGLRLEAIENVPTDHYRDAILGLEGRDRCVEHYQATLRALGEGGVDMLGLNWMAGGVGRSSFESAVGRGGARVTVYEQEFYEQRGPLYGGPYEPERVREAFASFLRDVLPVAEEAGVRIALHPDDPPVESLNGIPHVFNSVDALVWATEVHPSPNFGIDLCLGTVSEMTGDPTDAIRRLGEAGKIFYVHFRDVDGLSPNFRECFLGEGNYDPAAAMRALRDVGFDGFIIDDHAPMVEGDGYGEEEWNFRGHGHATGYLQGLLAAVATEAAA
jgi:mannonate dehydratase